MAKIRVIETSGTDQTTSEGESKMEEAVNIKEEAKSLKKKMQERAAAEAVVVVHDMHLGRCAMLSAIVGVTTIVTSTAVLLINKSITGGV